MTDTLDTAPPDVHTCIVAITRHGAAQAAELARHLPHASICTAEKFAATFAGLANPVRAYGGALRDEIGPLFAGFDQLVFFVSLGAVVRLVAPHLKNKDVDPGITVVDDAGQFAIPVLSGVVLAESESDDAGLAAGINDAFRQAGIAIGVAGLGAFFPAQSVLHGGSPHGFVDGLHTALWCSAAIAGVGVVVVAATMRRARATEPASAADATGFLLLKMMPGPWVNTASTFTPRCSPSGAKYLL